MSGTRILQRLLFAGFVGALLGGASLSASEPDDDRPLSPGDTARLARVKTLATAGKAKAQTRLAEYYLANGEATNAVVWFRRAANQGEVTAQLALASCYLAGQGTERDPAEAARLLRAAAARLEVAAAEPKHPAAPPSASAPRVQRVWTVQAPPMPSLELPPLQLTRATR
jgi:hypothetical protein